LADSINQARIESEFDLWAYVFMPDQVHSIIYPRRAIYDVAEIRAAIKHPASRVALAWLRQNRPHWIPRLIRKRGGKTETLFWQSGGGYDRNIESTRALFKMIEYLHMNPVRKGLVARADDWKWSSAGQYLGKVSSTLSVDPIPPHWLDQ
jgi:putative transposase